MEKKKVVALGCGLMGSLLISGYMENGHQVAIVNRTASKADEFVARGATYFEKLSDAIRETDPDLISFNLDTFDTCTTYLNEAADLIKGRIVVVLTTGQENKVLEFKALVDAMGGRYIDGCITCYPRNVGPNLDGSFVFAGDKEAWEEVKGILDSLSPMNIYMGEDVRAAPAVDVMWLCVHYGLYWGLMQAAAACRAMNISIDMYADAIKPMAIALIDMVHSNLKVVVANENYEPIDAKLYTQQLGLGEIIEYCSKRGLDTSVVEAILGLVNKAMDNGCRDLNLEVILKSIEKDF